MTKSDRIRAAALGTVPVVPRLRNWVGDQLQWTVFEYLDGWPPFFDTSESAQRAFLLLVAEALESA